MSRGNALGHAFWGRALFALEWRKICFFTYGVDPALLSRELPPGLSLELLDGQALVSLVAFQALYPSVLGLTPPSELRSTEIALRYLVREGPRRGSVTIREDSSSRGVAEAARVAFHEHTRNSPTRCREQMHDGAMSLTYEVELGDRTHAMHVTTGTRAADPKHESVAYLATQRPFGYARGKEGELLRYDLEHPLWQVYEPRDWRVEADFASLYGEQWALLGQRAPLDVTVAEGSAVRASLPE